MHTQDYTTIKSGLIAWLDPGHPSTTVASIKDRSASANNWIQNTSGNQGTLGTDPVNGAYLRLDATDDTYLPTTNISFTTGNPFTCAVIPRYRKTSTSADRRLVKGSNNFIIAAPYNDTWNSYNGAFNGPAHTIPMTAANPTLVAAVITFDGSGGMTWYSYGATASATTGSSGNTGNIGLGQGGADCDVFGVWIWNSLLNSTEISALYAKWLAEPFVFPNQLLLNSNSIGYGNNASDTAHGVFLKTVNELLQRSPGGWIYNNQSYPGRTTTDMLAQATGSGTNSRVDSLIATLCPRRVYFQWEVTNDIATGSSAETGNTSTGFANPTQAAANVATLCQGRKAAGFTDVISADMLPRGGTADSMRVSVNSILQSSAPTFCDAFLTLSADQTIGQATSNTDTTYYETSGSPIHPINPGHSVLAARFARAISDQLVTPSAANVRAGKTVGLTTGTLTVAAASAVLSSAVNDHASGTLPVAKVTKGAGGGLDERDVANPGPQGTGAAAGGTLDITDDNAMPGNGSISIGM